MKKLVISILMMFFICVNIWGTTVLNCDKLLSSDNKKLDEQINYQILDSLCEMILQREVVDSSIWYIDTVKVESEPHSAPNLIMNIDTLSNISIILLNKNNIIKVLLNMKMNRGKYLIYFDSKKIDTYLNKSKQFKILTIIGNRFTIENHLLIN